MKLLRFLVVLLLVQFLWCPTARAIDSHEDLVHFSAHFGMSYAINTFSYGFFSRAFKMKKWEALMFSAVATTFVGFVYKGLEASNGDDMRKAVFRNTIGIGASTLTILVFEF